MACVISVSEIAKCGAGVHAEASARDTHCVVVSRKRLADIAGTQKARRAYCVCPHQRRKRLINAR